MRATLTISLLTLGAVTALAPLGHAGTDAAQLTKPQFLKKGNAICSRGTQQMNIAGRTTFKSPGHPTAKETIAFAKKIAVPTQQRVLDQLRALSPPKGDEARVKAILAAAQAAVNKVRANPSLLGGNNGSDKANQLARAYGLTACAN